jgi:hypothetical protein
MLQEIPTAFWRHHSSAMQEVLTLQGGDNKGTYNVYFFLNDLFDVHIFDEFSFEKSIPRSLTN